MRPWALIFYLSFPIQTSPEEYNVVVLGSGEAGKYLAWTLAKQGMRAVVNERKYVGGSCPNIACLPSKNVIHSEGRLLLLEKRRIRHHQG
jgi:pyruvate/2-oxoglutarate dehydrogenase complex dihydrolipoamide dehydrogenase (E3) component